MLPRPYRFAPISKCRHWQNVGDGVANPVPLNGITFQSSGRFAYRLSVAHFHVGHLTKTMTEDQISISDIARQCGKRRQSVFKILKRLRIEPEKRRSSEKHGQVSSYITKAEFDIVKGELAAERESSSAPEDMLPTEYGVFYLVQLEPEHDPGRFKVGFASNIEERMRSHRCSAPFAKVVKTWPCRSLWEKTSIDCV